MQNMTSKHPNATTQLLRIDRPIEADWQRILEVLEMVNFHHIGSPEMPEFPLTDCFVTRVGGVLIGVGGYKILTPDAAKTNLLATDPQWWHFNTGNLLQHRRIHYRKQRCITTLSANCATIVSSPGAGAGLASYPPAN